ncbi:MAG: hypothetical protein WC794_00155 [Candidatus Doudnabacteria bacterium]|jgi:plastocyanin
MANSNGVKKTTIILVMAVLLAGGGYYLYQKNLAQAPTVPSADESGQQANQPQPDQSSADVPKPSGATTTKNNTSSPDYVPRTYSSGEGESLAPDIQVWQIDYDGTKFAPQTLNIKVGDYVIFKNTGTTSFWPASDPHPSHTGYPGFDAGKAIAAGGKYQFQFEKVGTWGFHNHLSPEAVGIVIVAQ